MNKHTTTTLLLYFGSLPSAEDSAALFSPACGRPSAEGAADEGATRSRTSRTRAATGRGVLDLGLFGFVGLALVLLPSAPLRELGDEGRETRAGSGTPGTASGTPTFSL